MTVASDQIIIFYMIGLIMFVFGIEEDRTPNDYLYMGLSFFINMIAYYLSYNESEYVSTAYFPLLLMVLSVVILIYKGYVYLKQTTSDEYDSGEDS